MPRNQKLTAVISGRTIQSATGEPGRLVVTFNDHSTMTVKTTGLAATISTDARTRPFSRMAMNALYSLRVALRSHSGLLIPAHRSPCVLATTR